MAEYATAPAKSIVDQIRDMGEEIRWNNLE